MNKYRTLAANTALMSAGTFGSKLLVFLMVRFYTGCLTPAEYGTADLITQTANLLIPVVSLDIPEGVFRFAADRQSDRADAFSAGVRTVTLGSAALLALLPLLQGVPGVPEYGALLVTFVIASCYHALCAQFVRAKGNTALFAVQGLLNTALFIGLNVLFLAGFRWGIRGYVLSTTAANVLTAAFLVGKARLWRELRLRPARGLQRQMLRYCVPLIPTAVFWWIMGVSDRYMVKWFLGSVYVVTKKSAASIRTSLAGAGLNVALNLWAHPAARNAGRRGGDLCRLPRGVFSPAGERPAAAAVPALRRTAGPRHRRAAGPDRVSPSALARVAPCAGHRTFCPPPAGISGYALHPARNFSQKAGRQMILTAFHGFCMALADSVPGVSGGTIAFVLGFYERFLDALHGLFRGRVAPLRRRGGAAGAEKCPLRALCVPRNCRGRGAGCAAAAAGPRDV